MYSLQKCRRFAEKGQFKEKTKKEKNKQTEAVSQLGGPV
jgi:hypothetical protein